MVIAPTCMCDTAVSWARNDESMAVSRSRCCWVISSLALRSDVDASDHASWRVHGARGGPGAPGARLLRRYRAGRQPRHAVRGRLARAVRVRRARRRRAPRARAARRPAGPRRPRGPRPRARRAARRQRRRRPCARPALVDRGRDRHRHAARRGRGDRAADPARRPLRDRARAARRRDRARRRRLGDEIAPAAAGVHARAAPADLPVTGARAAVEGLEEELDRYGEPHPALELGLRWLRARLPDEREPMLVHGDLRLGKVMVDEGAIVALLDWELTHAGDAAEDLGWMCQRAWRFGNDDAPALGVGTRRQLLDAYEAAGGRRITLDELRFWEVLANVRWGVICVMQAQRETLEHYAIGRRACEPEWDMLSLIA